MRCDSNASTEGEELGPDNLGGSGQAVWVVVRARDHGEGRIFRRTTGNARGERWVGGQGQTDLVSK